MYSDKATFAEVFDDLDTVPFFFPRRLVVVENADPFVTQYRAELETKVGSLSATGTLVLDVKTWQSTTRLAKLVDHSATLNCKALQPFKMPAWCTDWAKSQYTRSPSPAASLLIELIGPEMGLLDQELLKLAVYVGDRPKIDPADVDRLVGNNRTANTFKISTRWPPPTPKARWRSCTASSIRATTRCDCSALHNAVAAAGPGLSSAAQGVAADRPARPGRTPFGIKGAEQQLRHLGRRASNGSTTGCCKYNSTCTATARCRNERCSALADPVSEKNPQASTGS